ncbi:hypothetical protein FQN60_016704 [Etheostoma spectabile]|uniref:Uncharacterized protein n=1 Tax=Etheostoma spectabile TaxID=54343 RepID=A0A5J5CZN5_9PERO|nr:hypothetical protein FQN60_016704 [Etheostoma spectabile]
MGAVWAFVLCVLAVWINEGLSLPVGGKNEKRDNGLQSRVKDTSPNDISMMKVPLLPQSLGPKLTKAAKKAPLETNDVEAEASVGQLGHVQAPLNRPKGLKTNQMSGEKNTNQMPIPLLNWKSILFTNQTSGNELASMMSILFGSPTSDQLANMTPDLFGGLTSGEQFENITSALFPNLTSGEQLAIQESFPFNWTSALFPNLTSVDQLGIPESFPFNWTAALLANLLSDHPANQTSGNPPANLTLVPFIKPTSV